MRHLCVLALVASLLACKPPAEAPAAPPAAQPGADPVAVPVPAAAPVVAAPAAMPAAPTAVQIDAPAPDFALTDTDDKPVKLADFAGKFVVLEWFNPGCPFVKYVHEEGPLKTMAKEYADKGVVWLAINSSAAGKEGNGKARNAEAKTQWSLAHPILLDEAGEVGKKYGATRTPELFIIGKDGKVAYHGAPDNLPGGELAEGDGPEAYARNALDALLAGKPVAKAETQPRGCSVKYAK